MKKPNLKEKFMEQFNKHSAYALMNALKYIRKYVNKYPYFLVLFLLQEK